jgi:LacI family transcriptional regulator
MARYPGITISDLAQRLGVHKSTVSRAIDPQRRHLISADVLRRVDAAVRKLGYRPNRAAAALSTGRSRTVGVLLPDITNPVFPPILRGIEDALDAEGYFALVANTSRHDDAPRVAVERMLAQRVEGFLIASATRDDPWLDALRATGAVVVLVNRTSGDGHLPAVISDDMLGMRLAVDHLVELGHRRIAHLAGPAWLSTGMARRIGFEQALQQHGLSPAAIAECNAYSREAGHAGMLQLLKTSAPQTARSRARQRSIPRGFSAVVAGNDLIALGALQALQQHNIAVPGALSLIGHNDMPFIDQVNPPLSTVRIQHYEMGFRAARLALEALQGLPGSNETTIVLRPQLVVRASTGPPMR